MGGLGDDFQPDSIRIVRRWKHPDLQDYLLQKRVCFDELITVSQQPFQIGDHHVMSLFQFRLAGNHQGLRFREIGHRLPQPHSLVFTCFETRPDNIAVMPCLNTIQTVLNPALNDFRLSFEGLNRIVFKLFRLGKEPPHFSGELCAEC